MAGPGQSNGQLVPYNSANQASNSTTANTPTPTGYYAPWATGGLSNAGQLQSTNTTTSPTQPQNPENGWGPNLTGQPGSIYNHNRFNFQRPMTGQNFDYNQIGNILSQIFGNYR